MSRSAPQRGFPAATQLPEVRRRKAEAHLRDRRGDAVLKKPPGDFKIALIPFRNLRVSLRYLGAPFRYLRVPFRYLEVAFREPAFVFVTCVHVPDLPSHQTVRGAGNPHSLNVSFRAAAGLSGGDAAPGGPPQKGRSAPSRSPRGRRPQEAPWRFQDRADSVPQSPCLASLFRRSVPLSPRPVSLSRRSVPLSPRPVSLSRGRVPRACIRIRHVCPCP